MHIKIKNSRFFSLIFNDYFIAVFTICFFYIVRTNYEFSNVFQYYFSNVVLFSNSWVEIIVLQISLVFIGFTKLFESRITYYKYIILVICMFWVIQLEIYFFAYLFSILSDSLTWYSMSIISIIFSILLMFCFSYAIPIYLLNEKYKILKINLVIMFSTIISSYQLASIASNI